MVRPKDTGITDVVYSTDTITSLDDNEQNTELFTNNTR